jgi:hypothetical protein
MRVPAKVRAIIKEIQESGVTSAGHRPRADPSWR